MTAALTGEAGGWAAAAPHLELPDEFVALAANLERVDGERAAVTAELGPVSAAEQIVSGTAANIALDLDSEARQAAERATEGRRAVANAVRIARGRLDTWVADNRDALIDLAAPAVTALLADALVAAEALDPFAPAFDPVDISGEANPAQLNAWRDSRRTEQALDAVRKAWAVTWRAVTSGPPRRGRPGRSLHPGSRPGGIHLWGDPWAVLDVEVRDGRNTNVLAIAAWDAAGGQYRLATIAELMKLAERVPLARPHVAGERTQRNVLLPTEPKTHRSAHRAMGVG